MIQALARRTRVRDFDRGIERFQQQRRAFAKNAVIVDEQDVNGEFLLISARIISYRSGVTDGQPEP